MVADILITSNYIFTINEEITNLTVEFIYIYLF